MFASEAWGCKAIASADGIAVSAPRSEAKDLSNDVYSGLMPVYVDELIWERGGRLWCHLTADTAEELHAFASQLGLRRSRFQSKPGRSWVDHYDLPEPKRRQAVALGAVEITIGEAGAQLARKREAARRDSGD